MKASLEILTSAEVVSAGSRGRDQVRLGYTLRDPLAVSMTIAEKHLWVFARDLLSGDVMGLGDVEVELWDTETVVHLMPKTDEVATIVLPNHDVTGFLEQTWALCPRGNEFYDIDSWIRGCDSEETM